MSVMEIPENASSNPSVKSIDILVGDAWTVEPVIGIDVFRWAWAQAGAARPTMQVPATRMRAKEVFISELIAIFIGAPFEWL